MTGKEIKFRPATFYLEIADWLAREVEGQGKEGESEGEGGIESERKREEGVVTREAGDVVIETGEKPGQMQGVAEGSGDKKGQQIEDVGRKTRGEGASG
jgi:triacylglycerol lipase